MLGFTGLSTTESYRDAAAAAVVAPVGFSPFRGGSFMPKWPPVKSPTRTCARNMLYVSFASNLFGKHEKGTAKEESRAKYEPSP